MGKMSVGNEYFKFQDEQFEIHYTRAEGILWILSPDLVKSLRYYPLNLRRAVYSSVSENNIREQARLVPLEAKWLNFGVPFINCDGVIELFKAAPPTNQSLLEWLFQIAIPYLEKKMMRPTVTRYFFSNKTIMKYQSNGLPMPLYVV